MIPEKQAARWLEKFAAALAHADIDAACRLFAADGFWRDLVAFTWNIRTCEGREEIQAMLAATLTTAAPFAFVLRTCDADGAWFSFETRAGRGIGYLRLKGERCWTLLTTLQELKGFEEKAGRHREPGVDHGVIVGRRTWLENRQATESEYASGERQPYVVIVGGGQGGIALAARLKRLNVPCVVLEKNARAGDSWRRRYRSLCLHDPVWYDHLPYLPFPDHWPVFSPKDKIGDWLEMYTRVMELDYWNGAACLGAKFNEDTQEWAVEVDRGGRSMTLRPKHLVLATGMSGFPNVPQIAGADSFEGTIRHSSAHDGGEAWRGKHCVILGANNSAHDIAADLWEQGATEVTMIQRSSTVVVTSQALMEYAWGKLYSQEALERGISTEIADLTVASVPFKLLPQLQKPLYEAIRARDAKLYEGLDKVGFLYDFGEDGSGIHSTYLRRGSGYYIDVGASEMIIDGRIGLKSPSTLERFNRNSVVLADGSEIAADLVIYATGYGSMHQWAEQLISKEVADKVGKVWGLGSDTRYDPGPWVGELRNMWKPTAQPALWFHGGNLMQSRHYSLYLALQLKARMEGLAVLAY